MGPQQEIYIASDENDLALTLYDTCRIELFEGGILGFAVVGELQSAEGGTRTIWFRYIEPP